MRTFLQQIAAIATAGGSLCSRGGRHLRLWTSWPVLILLGALAVTGLAAATTSWSRSVSGVIGLTTEPVDYSGVVHAVTQVSGNSCQPTDPCQLFVNLAGVSGVGQVSGGVYRFVGASRVSLVAPPDVVTTVDVPGFVTVPPNPTQPTDPCRVRLELIVDSQGAVTVTGMRLVPQPPCGVDACP